MSGVLKSTVTQDVCIRGKMLGEWDFIEDCCVCVARHLRCAGRRVALRFMIRC